MMNAKGFDKWSGEYDESIKNSKGYPFEGYYDVLGYVQGQVLSKEKCRKHGFISRISITGFQKTWRIKSLTTLFPPTPFII